jgi:hypothetical protein
MEENVLVTGGGIHRIKLHPAAKRHSSAFIINLDKLTYAGNLRNVASIAGDPRYEFVQGGYWNPRVSDGRCDVHSSHRETARNDGGLPRGNRIPFRVYHIGTSRKAWQITHGDGLEANISCCSTFQLSLGTKGVKLGLKIVYNQFVAPSIF